MRFEWDSKSTHELASLVIYQSAIPQNIMYGEEVSKADYLSGVDYIIIDPLYAQERTLYAGGPQLNALVVMGGSDPHSLTREVSERILAANTGYHVEAVFGPAAKVVQINSRARTTIAPPSLLYRLADSRVAISALGMATYEAACLGVPTASICWSDDHEQTAIELERLGVTVNLGRWDRVDWDKMIDFMYKMRDGDKWMSMYNAGRRLVDGGGVKRVAESIEALL